MQFSSNTLLAVLTRILTLVNILGMLLMQLHFLGMEGQGKMAWVSSSIVIFTQFSQWVGGGALAYLSARRSAHEYFFPSLLWIAFGELLFILLLPLLINEPFSLLQCMMVLILCSTQALFTVFQNILLGKNRTINYHISICIQTSTTLLFSWILLSIHSDIDQLLLAMLLSFLITLLYSARVTYPEWKSFEIHGWKEQFLQLIHHGKYVQGANSLLLILVRIPVFIFPFISDGSFVRSGLYAMLLYLSEGILIFTKSFSVLQFAEICNTKEPPQIWGITIRYIKKSVIAAVLISICWCLFPLHFLTTFIDAPLGELQQLSFFFLPGILLQSMSIIYLHLFSGTGYFRFNFYNAVITFAAGCICLLVLFPLLKNPVQAAALSLSLAWIAQWLTYVILVQRWKRLEQIQ